MTNQLPARPNVEHLREQAKDLLKGARRGDRSAIDRIEAVSTAPFTLNQAQLAVAREYGFPSWPRLIEHVELLRAGAGIDQETARTYIRLALSDNEARLARLLELYPALPEFDPVCALVSGEASAVSRWLTPANVRESIGPENWEPLLYVCNSRVHRVRQAAHAGQLECARLILDAGANPNSFATYDENVKLPGLYAASDQSAHIGLVRLLLERGANPNDGESIYHAAQHDRREILDTLVEFGADLSSADPNWGNSPLYFLAGHRPTDHGAQTAIQGVKWLLDHGADPNVPCLENGETPLHALCLRGWGAQVIEPLLAHGADPNLKRSDGRTPYALAAVTGNTAAMEALSQHGAFTFLTDEDELVAAIVRGETGSSDAARSLAANPPAQLKLLFVRLAELGNAKALEAMLELGFDVGTTGSSGETALHFASFCGWKEVVTVLLSHGASLDLRDSEFQATPLGWALYGMCENRNEHGDYVGTIRQLLAAGADRGEVIACLDEENAPEGLQQVVQ